jgi:hypothetical protein
LNKPVAATQWFQPVDGYYKETEVDPNKTAILLIEYQNDFASEGGES